MSRQHRNLIALLGFAFMTPLFVQATEVTGAGATFVYPILAKWADSYKKESGHSINYQSIGSGGDIRQIQGKTVAARISDYTAFMYMGELIEFNPTNRVFTKPDVQLTEEYITGSFG